MARATVNFFSFFTPKEEAFKLSLKRVIEKLETLGLSNGDAMLYIYLAKNGPKKARNLSDELGIAKQQLYTRLKKLQEKKIITK